MMLYLACLGEPFFRIGVYSLAICYINFLALTNSEVSFLALARLVRASSRYSQVVDSISLQGTDKNRATDA